MSREAVGCCGAYCATCKVFKQRACRGCKIGYGAGGRDLSKAKCRIKICCMNNGYASCADCGKYTACETIRGFHRKNGYKYGKYREAVEFIIKNGYDRFIEIAEGWSMQYGKYE